MLKAWTTYYMQPSVGIGRAELIEAVTLGGFRPIDIAAGKSSAIGWAYADDGDPIADPADIDRVLADPLVVLGVRVEEIAIPYQVHKRQMAARVRALEEEVGRELSRDERDAIRDDVLTELRRRAIPTVRIVQVRIDDDSRRVYVGACPAGVRDDVVDLVQDLGYRLVIQSPFAAAVVNVDGLVDDDVAEVVGRERAVFGMGV